MVARTHARTHVYRAKKSPENLWPSGPGTLKTMCQQFNNNNNFRKLKFAELTTPTGVKKVNNGGAEGGACYEIGF